MAYSKAGQKAVDKYVKNNYDTILVRVKKGKKEEIQEFAQKQGKSVNGLICDLIDQEMKMVEK